MRGVTRLTLQAFRNYAHAMLPVEGALVVLTGPNGAGKTSILEAISLLVPGRGLRRAVLQEIGHQSYPALPWAVSARLEGQGGMVQVGTGLDPEAYTQGLYRRVVNIQGVTHRTQAALVQHVQALWLTPQMDRLFIDASTERRSFLDRLVFNLDPAHVTRLNRYEHVARERMRLLRDGGAHPAWLDALEDQMAQSGVAIEVARLRMVEILSTYLAQNDTVFPRAEITLQSSLVPLLQDGAALTAEDAFRDQLMQERSLHAQTGRTTVGPQRTDLITIFYEKKMPAALCSTGEQKGLLISLILAAARYLSAQSMGVPLLLLDEVVAHLDAARRQALFEMLEDLRIQTFMSGVDIEAFSPLKGAQHVTVRGGALIL